ncbi:drebrin isoform X2 [Brienomyrus brachyistius]|uniref:drebrin isoform X2 n=1 Tax=Brienomyrus brachyistius TaxID=42636 RepID=UPI0020B2157A|nr:drebrin isoform X2 [Brienomyrus brachyistius]
MAVNLSKNRLALLTAYQDVISETCSTDWAVYTYEDDGNNLTLASSGEGGLVEVSGKFDSSLVMYGFCSLKDPAASLPRYILINWVGEDVPDARKCACASHVATIAEFFQDVGREASTGVNVIINASSVDDIDPSAIGQKLTNGTTHVASPVLSRLRGKDEEQPENVGTTYQKTNAEIEMKKINREEFWEQAKREEELRKEEELKKAAEERKRFEEERMELERREQEERERRYREREQQIEEHRKKMQDEEEARERTRAQTLITEPSCDDSAQDKKESEVEEAAAIIAQRADNPREFFRQREKAMANEQDGSPVTIHRTGRLDSPFLKLQHSEPGLPPQAASHAPPHTRLQPGPPENSAEGSSDRAVEGLSPAPIPTIVTTPIQEEDTYQNDWDPEPEQRTPVQESAPAKPVQSVAPLARETPDNHSDFGVPPDAPPQQETDSLLDLWESAGPTPAMAPSQAAHLVDLMGDPVEAAPADVSAGLPQPLLDFDDLPEPPASFCQGPDGMDDPAHQVDLGGPHEMGLSYQHTLVQAGGSDSRELDDGQLLMTNGDSLLKESTQASEGYFSQSQEEEFAQSEDCSAKATPMPVFYNKPPEIDITCWDTDPVVEDDD